MVASIQPLELDYEEALQLRENIDTGVGYIYFFHGDADGATKTCRLLQMLLLAPIWILTSRLSIHICSPKCGRKRIKTRSCRVCSKFAIRESLKIFFLPAAPSLQYCVHNANSIYHAKLYFKRGVSFIEWEEGAGAYNFWKEERQKQGIASVPPLGVFHGASGFDMQWHL